MKMYGLIDQALLAVLDLGLVLEFGSVHLGGEGVLVGAGAFVLAALKTKQKIRKQVIHIQKTVLFLSVQLF